MSYKVLARKWRPQHFRDMIGQEPVLRALINALDTNRLHHAYLFTGMRGVGKTTIARILAKCLNCETKGVSSDPCGTCSACSDIEAGRFFDLIEVDAASRTKVDETRELLENVPYSPASGRYKVYLIDEVHMFSTHSFNALLKTLEEPPEHVKFLLATTDPQKVPVTVLSRCLQFNLKRLSPSVLSAHLGSVLNSEQIDYEAAALDALARASEGSVRDSLSLVEQAIAFGEGAVRTSDVEAMLGRASVDRLLRLIDALAAGDLPAVFKLVDDLAAYAPDFAELLGEILSLLHRIALLQKVPEAVSEQTPGYEQLSDLASRLEPDEIQLFYQIGIHARRELPFSPDDREAFDMALLRMQAFRPQGEGDPVRARDGIQAPGGVTLPGKSPDKLRHASLPVKGEVSAGGGLRVEALAAARGDIAVEPAKPASKDTVQRPDSETVPEPAMPINQQNWAAIVKQLDVSGMPRQLADNSVFLSLKNDRVVLQIEQTSEHLHTPRFAQRLQQSLGLWLGRSIQLSIETVNAEIATPARQLQRSRSDRMAAAEASINEDPVVKQLIDKVDGAVDPGSVQPLEDATPP